MLSQNRQLNRFCTETVCCSAKFASPRYGMVTAVLIFILWSVWSSACLFLLYDFINVFAVLYTEQCHSSAVCIIHMCAVAAVLLLYALISCDVYILFEYLNMRATDVCMSECFECRRCRVCMLTLTSVKFDSQSRTRWCLSTMILKMTVLVHEHGRASERTDEQASARKMTYDKYNNNNNNKWIVLGWACKQSVELYSTQMCVHCSYTHTHTRTQTFYFRDMPIFDSDFVTSTNMINASE